VQSSEFSMSGREAGLKLELSGDRNIEVAIRDGGLFIDGVRVAAAARGGDLDRSWREIVTRAMDASSGDLPGLLMGWTAPGAAGVQISAALNAALTGIEIPAAAVAADAQAAPISDTVYRLNDRIEELQRTVEELEDDRVVVHQTQRRNPFHYISEGFAGIFSILVTYAVLFAISFGVIFFGGRKYIEGVADTARSATGRSFLVGMAAAFLVVPAFVLGIIGLIISIVGIPGLLVFVPGFPVLCVLSVLLGYISVAHAVGESFAERRYYVTDWFQRGNSYYFLLSGFGLLLALFLASQVVHMAGPWLRAIGGILVFLGVVSTIVAVTTGFGAVLISRGGTRPVRGKGAAAEEPDLFTEDSGD